MGEFQRLPLVFLPPPLGLHTKLRLQLLLTLESLAFLPGHMTQPVSCHHGLNRLCRSASLNTLSPGAHLASQRRHRQVPVPPVPLRPVPRHRVPVVQPPVHPARVFPPVAAFPHTGNVLVETNPPEPLRTAGSS